jgi:hypothetical protein
LHLVTCLHSPFQTSSVAHIYMFLMTLPVLFSIFSYFLCLVYSLDLKEIFIKLKFYSHLIIQTIYNTVSSLFI